MATLKQTEKQQKLENRNGKKNNSMENLIDKTVKIAHQNTWKWLRKKKLKRET